jgi:hypothetical protein
MTATYFIEQLSKNRLNDRTKLTNSKVKGLLIQNTIQFIEKRYSRNMLETIIAKLELPQQIELRKKIDVDDWYSISLLIDLHFHLEAIKNTKKDVIQEIGKFDTEQNLHFFQKMKLKVLSSEQLFNVISKNLEVAFLPVRIKVVESNDKHVTLCVCDLFDPSDSIVKRLAGSLSAYLEAAGKQSVSVTIKDDLNSQDCYSLQSIWK